MQEKKQKKKFDIFDIYNNRRNAWHSFFVVNECIILERKVCDIIR